MVKSAFDVLREKIIDRIDTKGAAVKAGNPTNYPYYRELVGEIKGLDFALTEMEDLLQSHQEDEDDD